MYLYGLTGLVDVIRTADASLHIFGNVGYVELASGRVVAENGAEVNTVVLKAKLNDSDLNAIIEVVGSGTFVNKFAATNTIATLNNNDAKSIKLTLRTGDTDETKGDVLLAMDQQGLTGEDLNNAITATTTTVKANAQKSVMPDPYASAPANAEYAYVDEATGNIYYSLDSLKEAITNNTFKIVLLKDTTNPFQFIYNSTITFDLHGHVLDLSSESDGFGAVKSTVTIIDSGIGGTLRTRALEVMYDARINVEAGIIEFTDTSYGYVFGGGMAEFGLGGPIAVSGGTFNVDPTSKLVSGYTADKVGDVWVVRAQ